MKLAVFGYDQTILRAHSVLKKSFEEIEYFLVEPKRETCHKNFEDLAFLVDSMNIPAELALRTETHKQLQKKINISYLQFKKEIFDQALTSKTEVTLEPETGQQIFLISQIKDLFFESNKHKVVIEKETQGVTEFDFVIVEDHQLMTSALKNFSKSFFKQEPQQTHLWFSCRFSYELKSPRVSSLPMQKIILVKDSQNQSLIDNWYACYFKGAEVLIQQWVPTQQYQNLDFKKFIIERTRQEVSRQIEFIQLGECQENFVQATAGFSRAPSALKNKRLSATLPSFSFWSDTQVAQTTDKRLEVKIKKIQKLQTTRGLS